ncbi:hypothetical protein ACFW08_32725, partial [Streptomyces sp. NPDC058960]|uniref:hypothetical protein n=1 Tax=Streptomyces sp. NPDC058960 TaxID=3346679 RepID=UPI0036BFAF64
MEIGLAARHHLICDGDGSGIPGHTIEYGRISSHVQTFNEGLFECPERDSCCRLLALAVFCHPIPQVTSAELLKPLAVLTEITCRSPSGAEREGIRAG